MTRTTRARIDLSAARHNLSVSQNRVPGARQLAVIKANAYGHGMLDIADALHAADGFAVATLAEAVSLREAGVAKTLLVLQGVSAATQLQTAVRYRLQLVVHHAKQVAWLEQQSLTAPLHIWLKVDTGMHRLGVAPEQAGVLFDRLTACANVADPVVFMTHFANADERRDLTTAAQIRLFNETVTGFAGPRSLANSAGILAWPDSHADWVRPGIMLYGVSPFMGITGRELGLRPVMQLQSHLIAVNQQQKGAPIGYGGRYRCEEDMPVGVISIGYGDGYPRHAENGTPVLVNGQRVPLVGRVSMDMVCVDLRLQPNAQPGDAVVLWGDDLPVEEVAEHAQTIGYELLCGVTQRVEFVYTD